jgi:hypothetical protein
MHTAADLEIERVLIELDQMCDAFERRGWLMQAAEAEQLYANIHRRIGRAIPHQRAERLMRELAAFEPPPRRAVGSR